MLDHLATERPRGKVLMNASKCAYCTAFLSGHYEPKHALDMSLQTGTRQCANVYYVSTSLGPQSAVQAGMNIHEHTQQHA